MPGSGPSVGLMSGGGHPVLMVSRSYVSCWEKGGLAVESVRVVTAGGVSPGLMRRGRDVVADETAGERS